MPPEPFSPVRPEDHALWSCNDHESSEDEVVSLMHALIRAEKPLVCVEVGAHIGLSSAAIGQALHDNGRGHLHSFEGDPFIAAQARAKVFDLPVTVYAAFDIESPPHRFGPIDFLFIDGTLHNRLESWNHWRSGLAPHALVAVHDSLKYAGVSAQIDAMNLPRVDIRTPRGLALLRA